MSVVTSQSQGNTRTCSICGKPLERWEDGVHLACYIEKNQINDILRRIDVPVLHQEVIKAGGIQSPPANLVNLLITEQKQGILFTGAAGTGKTLLSCYITVEYVIRTSATARYINAPSFFNEIKQSFSTGEPVKPGRYNEYGLLILDDIGAENTTEWTNEILYLIINDRYVNRKKVIVTTNMTVQALAQSIGDRTVSRLVEMCQRMDLGTQDRRLHNMLSVQNGKPTGTV